MKRHELYGIDVQPPKLEYVAVEVSYGSQWININDKIRYVVNADQTRDTSSKTWRKITSQSPILGGTYLIHAVPEMVNEQIGIWVHGASQAELNENLLLLEDLFTQFDYRVRWTLNDYRETWRCQLADTQVSRGQVWTHNNMAAAMFTVPRWPDVTTEVFE